MIIWDACDDTEYRSDDIGRIESPSHPYLHDSIFAADISEIEKSKQRTPLIVGELPCILHNPSDIRDKIKLRDESILHLEAFSDIDVVGTRIDSDFFSWLFEYLEYHLLDTSLPIGSCDMDRLELILRIVEVCTCRSDIVEWVVHLMLWVEKSSKELFIGIIHGFYHGGCVGNRIEPDRKEAYRVLT
jgi:hypothetical protein